MTATDRGETTPTLRFLNRRGFAGGLAAFGALIATPVLAQDASATGTLLPPAEDEAAVLANLFTRMSTKTSINGHAGYNLVLDTGAGCSAIAQDIAASLGLPAGPQIVVHGVTSAQIAPTVRIARLAFGGRRFNDVHAAVFPRELLGADGLLGLDVLSGFELSFNMTRRTMMLTPSGVDAIQFNRIYGSSRIPRNPTSRTRTGRFGQLILLNARANGVPVECFVDSGAQSSIGNMALYRALGGASGATVQQRVLTEVYGVTGQTLMAERGGVGNLEISRQRLGPTPLLFADLHAFGSLDMLDRPALLIGGDVLYRFRTVSLDFGRSRMAFVGLRRPIAPVTTRL